MTFTFSSSIPEVCVHPVPPSLLKMLHAASGATDRFSDQHSLASASEGEEAAIFEKGPQQTLSLQTPKNNKKL
jgi:hypothetical protein